MARKSRKFQTEKTTGEGFRVYKTALYIRLSVEDARKKQSDSVAVQKAFLMNFLQSKPELELYNIYEDVNYSGTNFNRPGFARMMADVGAGLADCVVVRDLSRFGRNFTETGNFLERVFPSLSVRFISVADNYDSLNAKPDDSNLTVPLKNLVNAIFAKDISKKVKSGKKAKRRRGEFCGSFAPYGYVKKGTKLYADEETADTVRRIFSWAADGVSAYEIAKRLNGLNIFPPGRYRFEKGITKTNGESSRWHKSAVGRILRNPVYTGALVSGKYGDVYFRDAHQALVSGEVFEAVQIRKGLSS